MAQLESDRQLEDALHTIYGPGATFRPGQKEAIQAVLAGKRTLVVQKTGWGKSLIYFLAAKLLREAGRGFSIVISPLLALMNDQIVAAGKFGLRAATINSQNIEDWALVADGLLTGGVDILFISPERLANEQFNRTILDPNMGDIGMLVIDEAHCISDWGHDFRPDYRLIVRIIQMLPPHVPLLATTATANDRVIGDICDQMGPNLHVLRGPLARDSLYIQVIHLAEKEQRLAWLSENVPYLEGDGVIYCLTQADCQIVSSYLARQGIAAAPYSGDMAAVERRALEDRFLRGDIRVLIATVAYGMGIDKPDIAFVIHFQRPGNVVAYYQQIGRAGRALNLARAILLTGDGDDAINRYFIESAFPSAREMDAVIHLLEASDGLGKSALLRGVNISLGKLEKTLSYLFANGHIYHEGGKYYKSPRPWQLDYTHSEGITQIRYRELREMNEFTRLRSCYMEFISRRLNDPDARPCGHCANCVPLEQLPETVSPEAVDRARQFLRSNHYAIEPRKRWPNGVKVGGTNVIRDNETYRTGCVLSLYGDAGWGGLVARGKYEDRAFSQELVNASVDVLAEKCVQWEIDWITAVPSLRNPELVRRFAQALADRLSLPYHDSLAKRQDSPPQKGMQNSHLQYENADRSFAVRQVLPGNVLLVDDMVDSRWTLTVCAYKLIQAGAGQVYPFALANSAGSGGRDT